MLRKAEKGTIKWNVKVKTMLFVLFNSALSLMVPHDLNCTSFSIHDVCNHILNVMG